MSTRDLLIILLIVVVVATVFGLDWRWTSPIGLILLIALVLVLLGRF